ncbi:MAG: DNA glycosylase [Lachnospiraceae bacterium]|nr:DNA glycosylase [Lachnospiraceae bacterium]
MDTRITKQIQNFNLYQIAKSGQCFRMNPVPGSENPACSVISGSHHAIVSQEGSAVSFFCEEKELPFWERYFDLETDYGRFLAAIPGEDAYLQAAAAFGSGIRILRQDLWEMIITFVISQQKSIPAIKALVEALCTRYGTQIESFVYRFYAFPSPEQLNRASLEELQALKLGYRAKYIKKICEDACEGLLDLNRLPSMGYEEAMEYLMRFYGIGRKVANCVCLFGLHQIDAFPVDTWIRKILLREYAPKSRLTASVPKTRLCDALVEENFSRYVGFAGVIQQYIFYYERQLAGRYSKTSD